MVQLCQALKIVEFSVYFLLRIKNPIVGRPIVAGYNWILSPALIFVEHYLKEFCTKFDAILMDSLSLVKFLQKEKFDPDDFLFTVDFVSL